jgi:hypothetical protein
MAAGCGLLLNYKDVYMRKYILALLVMLCTNVWADSIRCFDHGRVIYYRNIKNVTFTGEMFVFIEDPSDKVVMYTGKCLVKIDA